MWYQRSRTVWMHDGDRNIKYYQIKAANRKRKNCIHVLRNDQGRWFEDEDSTKVHVTSFYKSLFTEMGEPTVRPNLRYGFTPFDNDVAFSLGQTR